MLRTAVDALPGFLRQSVPGIGLWIVLKSGSSYTKN
jgi:hypothetical protein